MIFKKSRSSLIEKDRLHSKLAMWGGVHERRRKLRPRRWRGQGRLNFFVRGDFFCSSFVWPTKEEKSHNRAQDQKTRIGNYKEPKTRNKTIHNSVYKPLLVVGLRRSVLLVTLV
jgi:hypothetical protein